MVQDKVVKLGHSPPESLVTDVPVGRPGKLAVGERRRTSKLAQPVVHAERQHGSDQHLLALTGGDLAS